MMPASAADEAVDPHARDIRGARNLPASGVKVGKDVGEVRQANDDGRLPMEDHAVAKEAFLNVAFFGGTYGDLKATIK